MFPLHARLSPVHAFSGQISRAAGWRYSGDRELRRDVYVTATPVCLDELDALEKAKLGSVRGSEWL